MHPESEFSVSRHQTGDVVTIAPNGEIDLETVDAVRREFASACAEARNITLDLRAVSFMDSSGLRVLIESQRDADAAGLTFAIVRGPASVQRLLELSGITDRLNFVAAPAEGRDPADPG